MTTYTVTALTPDGETVWLDVAPSTGWLVMTREPVFHHHGPRLQNVVWVAVLDPHLSNVTVNEQGESE
jgi:hypothetical protein